MGWTARPSMLAGDVVRQEDLDALLDRIELLSSMPTAHMRQIVAQSIPNGTTTPITFTAHDIDSHGGHSTTTNTSRYTCQVAGTYQLAGGIGWSSSTAGRRNAWWRKNGSDVVGTESGADSDVTGIIATIARTILIDLDVGDYVELTGTQESGGSLNTAVVATQQSSMSVRLVTPAT